MIIRCFTAVVSALTVTGYGVAAVAQSPAAAPAAATAAAPAAATAAAPAAQANSICGNQAFCYEASDFAATVTDFRTTTQGYYKIIDATVRFTNKTASTIGLGYANGSGMATDDRGNRYQVGGANAFRGIGAVNGSNFDPKMVIRPGGFADARYELLLSAGAEVVVGLTFELDLTVDELNAVEGNQFTMAGETPLQFKSLTNGSTGAAPGQVAYSSGGQVTTASPMASAATRPAPCSNGATGGSTATSIANATNSSTVQTASSNVAAATASTSAAIANVGSIFGKKKAAPTATTAASTTATAPCTAAGSTAPAAATASAAAPRTTTAVATAPRATTTAATTAATAPRAATTAATTAATAPRAATPPTPPARNVAAAPPAKAATTGNITTAKIAPAPVKAQSKDSGVVAIPAKP